MCEFVTRHDDANTLLIVYYTGHGALKVSDERLQFYAGPGRGLANQHDLIAYWDEAEVPLLDSRTKADVLAVLDCCFSGNAQKGQRRKDRVYELLAAAPPEESTPAPGPRSFTNSLNSCLRTLLEESEGHGFTTTKLSARLGRCRHPFQSPVLYNQLHKHEQRLERHVLLKPVNKQVGKRRKREEAVRAYNSYVRTAALIMHYESDGQSHSALDLEVSIVRSATSRCEDL
jgi:hypothetical protein